MGIKVSEMAEAESVNDEDLIMIVQKKKKKKVPASKVGTGQAGGDTLPIGAVMEWNSDIIPINWLLCDGQAVSRTDYSKLFEVLGTRYGEGDGSTTFNLPNRKGNIAVGKDENDTDFNTLGKTGGEKTHTLTVNEMPAHMHTFTGTYYALMSGGGSQEFGSGSSKSTEVKMKSAGGGQAHNNMQPYVVSNFIIKAKQSAGIIATVVDNLESESEIDALSARQGKKLADRIYTNIITGEEFETNKTIDGKRIYGKRINCGQLPDPGQGSTTSTGLANVTYIGLEGGFNPDASQFVPCNIYFNSNLSIGAFIQNNNVRVNNNDSGNRTGLVYVTVYYTKN